METIRFTRKNGAEVKAWVNRMAAKPDGESWFLTRGMSASTGNQAWNYVRNGREWPEEVTGAVYDGEQWVAVPVGASIAFVDGKFSVK